MNKQEVPLMQEKKLPLMQEASAELMLENLIKLRTSIESDMVAQNKCPKHGIPLDDLGDCPKCLEEEDAASECKNGSCGFYS